MSVAGEGNTLWVVGAGRGPLLRLSLSTGRQTAFTSAPFSSPVATGGNAVWVVNGFDSVSELAPDSGRIRHTYRTGTVCDLAATPSAVWVLTEKDKTPSGDPGRFGLTGFPDTLLRIDRSSGKVQRFEPGFDYRTPCDIETAGEDAWLIVGENWGPLPNGRIAFAPSHYLGLTEIGPNMHVLQHHSDVDTSQGLGPAGRIWLATDHSGVWFTEVEGGANPRPDADWIGHLDKAGNLTRHRLGSAFGASPGILWITAMDGHVWFSGGDEAARRVFLGRLDFHAGPAGNHI